MNYKISAVIPMYNAENTIIRALKSIEKQTHGVDEILIINDGSTDRSADFVKEYIKISTIKIKLITQNNSGVSSARNTGIKLANHDFIAFLDSDDEWCIDKLKLQMPLFDDFSVVLVGGNYFPGIKTISSYEVSAYMQLFKNRFQTSTVVVRANALKKFDGFYSKQKYAEEGRFYFDISKFGKLILLNTQVVIYDGGDKRGFGDSGLSANLIEMQKGELSNINYACELYRFNIVTKINSLVFSYLKFFRRVVISSIK